MNTLLDRAAWTRVYAWPFLGLFAFNLLVFLGFTLPRSLKERSVVRQALALRETSAVRRQEIAAVRRQADIVNANQEESVRFYREVVPECAVARAAIPQDLYRITSDLTLKSERVSIAEDEVKGVPLTQVSFTMPLEGTYQQVGSFLQKVESSPHFLIVEGVQMRERTEGGGGALLDVRLQSYCRPAEGPRAARRSKTS